MISRLDLQAIPAWNKEKIDILLHNLEYIFLSWDNIMWLGMVIYIYIIHTIQIDVIKNGYPPWFGRHIRVHINFVLL